MFHPDVSFSSLLKNLALTAPILTRVVFGAMYIAGFLFVMSGIYRLKHYGDIRTMMSSSAEIKTPLIYLFVGACLIFYPQVVKISLASVFNTPGILHYAESTTQTSETFEDILLIVMLVGFIAFFRGMMMLTKIGNHSAGQNTFGKALTHIIGGILAVNFYGTWTIMKSALGL